MIRSRHCHLEVFIAGTHAGELRISPEGALSFAYDPSYVGPDLSLILPFSTQEYSGREVHAWFDNLLPDNSQVRQGMAIESGTSTGLFPLLSYFGLELPGAVQIVAPNNLDALLTQTEGYVQISPETIGERLINIISAENENRARSWAHSEERWSLGGMQTKIAFREFEGRWYECTGKSASNVIIKPGAWGMPRQALIECITMNLAERCGLPAATTQLMSFADMDALVVQRYDRFTSPESGLVSRIHQEDFCQATGTVAECKYAADGGPSALEIMALLESAQDNSRKRFVDAILFNYLTASTDAHAKNYSLLHLRDSEFVLAPLYDLASAAPYLKRGKTYRLAMAIGGENRLGWLRRSSLEKFAKTNHCDIETLLDRTEELAETIKDNLEDVINEQQQQDGVDEVASTLIPRITALCNAAQRNIRSDASHFKPIDITRYGHTIE